MMIRSPATLRIGSGGLLLACALAIGGPASATEWAVDPRRSTLGFELVETGNPVSGRFARWTAEIRFDSADPAAARLRVVVETASATTGERRRDEMMTGPDWFDSGRIPFAVFEAEGFRALGGDRFETTGTLRLRDGVRPLTLTFTLVVAGDEAHTRGRGTLVRTQFGIGQGQWGGTTVAGLDVAVIFDVTARRLP